VILRSRIERTFLAAAILAVSAAASFSQRLHLAPRLRAGQILFYRIDFSGSRNMQTESNVASPQLPPSSNISANGLLQVEIMEASAIGLHLKTYYSERDSSPVPPAVARGSRASGSLNPDRLVEVSIASNGNASQIKGLDQLSPAQQFAWNDWLGRFTSSMTFPKTGIHAGEKWQTTEPESNPSPIAALVWSKKYQYVHDEPCAFRLQSQKTGAQDSSAAPNEVCAVIFSQSKLRQKSSPKNSTPHDYKLRDLKTRGTAAGNNETILYFEHSTGVLVRATEDAQQSMDVLVALVDGSNAVHYTLDAKSHCSILLLPDSAPSAH
jgi:hypothetical protein